MKTRIRELREAAALTQKDLAERVDVRRETIVFLEKGRYNPSLKLAHRIAKVFGQPIEGIFLLEDDGGEKERPNSCLGGES